MHSTFWTLAHGVLVAALCMLWAPGELVSCYMGPREQQQAAAAVRDSVPLLPDKASLGWRRPQDKLAV